MLYPVRIFLVLICLSFAQSANAQKFNLAKLEEEWNGFYEAVGSSDVEQLLKIRDGLEPREEYIEIYLLALIVLSDRFIELNETEAVMETLHRALATSPTETSVSDSYANLWSQALDQLCQTLFEQQEYKQVLAALAKYESVVSSYCQTAQFAEVRLRWRGAIFDREAIAEEAKATLETLVTQLPVEPRPLEIKALLDIAKGIPSSRTPVALRIRVILHCRNLAHSLIQKYPDRAFEYFSRTAEASYAATKLFIGKKADLKRLDELLQFLKQANTDLQAVVSEDRIREFGENSIAEYEKYLKREMEKVANASPIRKDSKLIGRSAPELDDALVLLGRIPELGGNSNNVVLIDFWETWCAPCIASFPKINSLSEKYGDKGLRIVGVAGLTNGTWDPEMARLKADLTADRETSVEAMKSLVRHHKLSGCQIVDEKGTIKKAYDVTSFPTYVLIDRAGTVVFVGGGASDTISLLEQKIAELLDDKNE